MKKPSYEDGLQRACAQYCNAQGWLWMHCPNEGKRGKAAAGKLAAHGLKRGVPDILIFEWWSEFKSSDLRHGFGIAIELKSPKGTLTAEQREWLKGLGSRCWHTAVCRTINEFISETSCIMKE